MNRHRLIDLFVERVLNPLWLWWTGAPFEGGAGVDLNEEA